MQCKCGELKGLEYLRMTCSNCGDKIMTDHPLEESVTCSSCGSVEPNRVTKCDTCGGPVELQLKYSIADCQERGMTFAVPLKVTFRLFVYDKDPETGTRMMRDAKEEEVYFGEIPLMTDNGTFIVNGTERVIVSQLHRSPGVFFTKEGPRTFLSKIIPYRGSWVEFEYDQKEILSVRIDRKRKFHGTVFLRALGLETDEAILRQFYSPVGLTSEGKGKYTSTSALRSSSRNVCATSSREVQETAMSCLAASPSTRARSSIWTVVAAWTSRLALPSSNGPSSSPTWSTSRPVRSSWRPTI